MLARVLIDNITKSELHSEWGLAIYIEYEGHKLLLDTGATGRFVENAPALLVELSEVEYGVLSHAHYDHSDGMERFFQQNEKAKFYLRKSAAENCYGKKWVFSRYIGIHKGYLESYQDRIIYAEGDYEIIPGVYLIPHKTSGLEALGKQAGMYVKKKNKWYADDFSHEQSLVFDTPKGLVILNSCSHGGVDNIMKEIVDTFPDKKLYAFIGGFHLFESPEREVRALADRIKEIGVERVITGHCTGKRAFAVLKEELGDQLELLYTGKEIEI